MRVGEGGRGASGGDGFCGDGCGDFGAGVAGGEWGRGEEGGVRGSEGARKAVLGSASFPCPATKRCGPPLSCRPAGQRKDASFPFPAGRSGVPAAVVQSAFQAAPPPPFPPTPLPPSPASALLPFPSPFLPSPLSPFLSFVASAWRRPPAVDLQTCSPFWRSKAELKNARGLRGAGEAPVRVAGARRVADALQRPGGPAAKRRYEAPLILQC